MHRRHATPTLPTFAALVAAGALSLAAAAVHAQPGSDYDFDFVTIGAPGNVPYTGDSPFGAPIAYGRGNVAYEYRIGRTEVTTSQWIEFVNVFSMREDPSLGIRLEPNFWGAQMDSSYTGPGLRWVPRTDVNGGMLPVQGISWRDAARFCNWLHNGKSTDAASLDNGAYDASTWGNTESGFTDDPTHLPGARFWIPSLDEWMKSTHFDPNRFGNGQGGWWLYPNGADEPLVGGPPGVGQTSAGYLSEELWGEWDVPLGAYPDTLTPWGLLDASGGAREWIEEVFYWPGGIQRNRGLAGSSAGFGGPSESYIYDHVSAYGSTHPGVSEAGLRIAAAVPAPSCAWLAVLGILHARRRRAST